MKSGRYTIRELLCDGDIDYFCIPEIQRDYVWNDAQVRPFIKNIMESMNRPRPDLSDIPQDHRSAYTAFLEQSARYNIGFIYAYFDRAVPERFFLIDGQQRLTTLYLFLAVLAAKLKETLCDKFISRYFRQISAHNGPDSYQLKVDYKVREVAHVVLQHVIFDLTAPHENSVSRDYVNALLNGTWNWENKIRPDWWQHRFENDVTIKSIFQNISLMANMLSEEFNEFGKLFNYIENHVEVWYFDTDLSRQGEELYIYMNSRGEQLSYNENRRAACLALCENADTKKEYAKKWDDTLQNKFWKWRDNNPSADKGLDLFLHTVEMITIILDDSKTVEYRDNAWRDFIEKGKCIDCQASTDMLEKYFSYSKVPIAFDIFLENQPWKKEMLNFLHGEWESTPKQIEAIRVFVALELLKGRENFNDDLKLNFSNCQLFFDNLLRHELVAKNPKDYIVHFMRLANFCRNHSCNILALADAAEFKNPLVTDEEKMKLDYLSKFTPARAHERLSFLEEILNENSLLKGRIYLLIYAAAPDDGIDTNPYELLEKEEVREKIKVLNVKLNESFKSKDIYNAISFGNCFRYYSVQRTQYTYHFAASADAWYSNFYDYNNKEDFTTPNPVIVNFIKNDFRLSDPFVNIREECCWHWLQKLFSSEETRNVILNRTDDYHSRFGEFGNKIYFRGGFALFSKVSSFADRKFFERDDVKQILIMDYDNTDFILKIDGTDVGKRIPIQKMDNGNLVWNFDELNAFVNHFQTEGNLVYSYGPVAEASLTGVVNEDF